jgi:hypothetical protein
MPQNRIEFLVEAIATLPEKDQAELLDALVEMRAEQLGIDAPDERL